MDDLLPQIIALWRRSGIPNRAGVRPAAITAFEARYNVRLTADVRTYLSTVDGTGDEMDDDLFFRFWPLAEIKPVRDVLVDTKSRFQHPDRYLYPDCFVFADHCVSCWDYAVKLTSEPDQPAPVYRVTGSEIPGERLADSFREFMAKYVADPTSIL